MEKGLWYIGDYYYYIDIRGKFSRPQLSLLYVGNTRDKNWRKDFGSIGLFVVVDYYLHIYQSAGKEWYNYG